MRTNFDPPSDPEGFMACRHCDQPLMKESRARDADYFCVNPDCKRSPRYVPFIMIPNDLHYRFVNDNQEDVAIRLRQGAHTYDDLIILRFAEDELHYGWFIEQVLMDDEHQTEPRYFKTLEEAVKDAIGYIEKSNNIEWAIGAFLLEVLLRVNQ
jgi:hypothetical protein